MLSSASKYSKPYKARSASEIKLEGFIFFRIERAESGFVWSAVSAVFKSLGNKEQPTNNTNNIGIILHAVGRTKYILPKHLLNITP